MNWRNLRHRSKPYKAKFEEGLIWGTRGDVLQLAQVLREANWRGRRSRSPFGNRREDFSSSLSWGTWDERRKQTPPHNLMADAMSQALYQISHSPFFQQIEHSNLPYYFVQLAFVIYNGKTDPIKHVSHFNQSMTIYSRNKALMCEVFPSSLRLIVMRWFNGLDKGSI